MKAKSLTRRSFLGNCTKGIVAAWAGPLILPSGLLAQPGRPGPNDRVGIGYIGVGRRAKQLMGLPPDAETVAIADVYTARFDEFAAGKDWKRYTDYREMLQSPDVDAVIIASPDHWHALHAVHACDAGKDAYVEKPLSLTVREGRAMVDAARKHGRVVQTGSQQRSMPETQQGIALLHGGRIGKVHTVHGANYPSPWDCDLPEQPIPDGLNWDTWLGQTQPRPFHMDIYLPRAKPGWISFRPWSGGEMTGWGAHGLDVVQWALKSESSGPVEVWPEEGETLKRPVTFRMADGTIVKLDGGGPGGGAVFEGEEGRLVVDRAFHALLGPDERFPEKPKTGPDRTNEHIKNWIDCIRSREKPVGDVEIGHRAAVMCHLGNIARWTGRKLQWDPEIEQFVNDDDANTYLERPMRAPWAL